MRPLTVITGIVLGSTFSIAFGLAVVWLIFRIIGSEEPLVADEITVLGPAIALFTVLTAIAAASFLARVKGWRYSWLWQLAMWSSLALAVLSWRTFFAG